MSAGALGTFAQLAAHVLINSLAVLISAYVLPGVTVSNLGAAVVTAVMLGVVNALVRPLLVVLTLPITVLTLGFFLLVINALVILLVDVIVPGFAVASFWSALLFSVVLSLVNGFLRSLEHAA